jgi:hypothetical protein
VTENRRPRRLAVSDRQAIAPLVADLPTAQTLLEHLGELEGHTAGERGWARRRDRRADLGRALRRVGALLWGERVVRPIRVGAVHDAQMIVLASSVDRLIHPDKRYESRTGSADYHDRARRRLTAWYWSTTFSGDVPRTREGRAETIRCLLAWCSDTGPPPAAQPAPDLQWIADVSYLRRRWRYQAVLALLGRRAPRDLLTGERLEVEQPDIVPAERVDSVVNIAPLTAYTNVWIRARAPAEYVAGIRAVVGDQGLRTLLDGHLIEPELLEAHDFDRFWTRRLDRIHTMIVEAVDAAGRSADATGPPS